MILFANAKINIGLKVKSQRPDGFRDIESLFYPIPLFDLLEIMPSDQFKLQNSGIQIDTNQNLVLDAFNLLKEHFNIGNAFIHLHKQIPLGSGLGGGSSDATFCLKGLNKLFNLGLNNETLKSLALELGSDCPFFIENVPSIVSGRGEIIQPSDQSFSGKYLKIIYPDIHISTREAFSNIEKTDQNDLDKNVFINDFQYWAFKRHPELSKIRIQLIDEGAQIASMTGTGSTIYGIYQNKPNKSTRL